MIRSHASLYAALVVSGLFILAGCDGDSIYAPEELSWRQTSTLFSSAVSSLVIDGQGRIFAGTKGHGIMSSTDNGATWECVNNGLRDRYIYSLAISGDGALFAGSHSNIYRSADGGSSWMKLDYGLETNRYFTLAVDPYGNIFAVGYEGAIRSLDDGMTWEELAAYPFRLGCHTLAINKEGHIFAVAGDIIRSTDRGESWELVFDHQGNDALAMFSLAIEPDGTMYAGSQNGVYVSADNGDTWNLVCEKCPGIGPYDPLVVDSTTGVLYAGYYDGICRSADGGYSWERAHDGISDKRIECIALNEAGDVFAGATLGAIYRSSDQGDSWRQVNITGLPINAGIRHIVATPEGLIFCTLYYDGISRSDDNGATWKIVSSAKTFCLVANAESHIYAGTWSGIIRSRDSGNTWQACEIEPAIYAVQDLCIDERGYLFAADPFNGVYRSIDDGDTWTHLGLADDNIRAVQVSSDGTLFAGGDEAIFLSHNEGKEWHCIKCPYEHMYIQFLVLRGENDLYVGKDYRLLHLDLDSFRWEELKIFSELFALLAPEGYPGLLIACSWGYIDYSRNDGQDWTKTTSGFSHKYVRSLALDNEGYILAGTGSYGIYRSTMTADELAGGF